MADVVYQLDAIGGNKVEKEAARAEKAMNKTQRASARGGLAVLEASRAIEDFTMAGMKGALNNIPGLLMHLGIGAGLTGVVSVATVAVWKGYEALKAYAKAMDDAQAVRLEKTGIERLDLDIYSKQFSKQGEQRMKEIESLMTAMNGAQEAIDHSANLLAKEQASERELNNAKEMYELTAKGASEEEKRAATVRQRIEEERQAAKASADSLASSEANLSRLLAAKRGQLDLLEKTKPEDIDRIVDRQEKVYSREYEEQIAMPGVTDFQAATRARERSLSNRDMMIESLFGSKEEFDIAVRQRVEAEAALKIIDQKINSQTILVDRMKLESKVSENIAKNKEEQLKIEEQITSEQEREKERVDMQKAMMDERVIDPEPFLTSQGRAGLSGSETQSAMGLIGIARQQLGSLKQIERNTRNFTTAYA